MPQLADPGAHGAVCCAWNNVGVPEGLWIALAVVAILAVMTALAVGLLLYRRRRISLSAAQRTGTRERPARYIASSGITLGTAAPRSSRLSEVTPPGSAATVPPGRMLRSRPRRRG